jgi:hypothetical protein
VTRSSVTPGGTLVLDSEGLAKAVLRDRAITTWLALARADDLRVITSAATLVELNCTLIARRSARDLVVHAQRAHPRPSDHAVHHRPARRGSGPGRPPSMWHVAGQFHFSKTRLLPAL